MGKRESNKALIKERLISVSRELFTEKGFNNTTVADIVEQAGIGRGTFYNYFSDLKEIFDLVVDKMNLEVQKEIYRNTRDVKGIHDYLYAAYKSYFEFVSQGHIKKFHVNNILYIRNAGYNSQSIQKYIRRLQKELREHKVIGKLNNEYEIQLLSFILVGAPAELFFNLVNTKLDFNIEESASFLAKIFSKIYREKQL